MSVLAARSLTFGDLSDYLTRCAGPALVAIHVLPTLAAADGREVPPLWPTLPVAPSELRAHFLAHSPLPRERWWTALTSMLLHFDEEHRAANALALLLAGLGPFTAMGTACWWLTLLGGNAVAVLTLEQRRQRQARAVVERYSGGMLSQDGGVAGWLSRGAQVVPAAACGASAGVFALLGADLCLTVERVWTLVDELRRRPNDVLPLDALQALGLSLPALQRTLSLVEAERRAAGQSAHLTGFGVGVLCYVLFRRRAARQMVALWRRRGARRPPGAGRRLGSA